MDQISRSAAGPAQLDEALAGVPLDQAPDVLLFDSSAPGLERFGPSSPRGDLAKENRKITQPPGTIALQWWGSNAPRARDREGKHSESIAARYFVRRRRTDAYSPRFNPTPSGDDTQGHHESRLDLKPATLGFPPPEWIACGASAARCRNEALQT